jgi:hypothetical protein
MHPRPGQTLRSITDSTTVVVVRTPRDDVKLTCGGEEMTDARTAAPPGLVAPLPGHTAGTLLGKRYEDAAGAIELLCTKGGTSSLAVDGVPMTIKAAKPLPASD